MKVELDILMLDDNLYNELVIECKRHDVDLNDLKECRDIKNIKIIYEGEK